MTHFQGAAGPLSALAQALQRDCHTCATEAPPQSDSPYSRLSESSTARFGVFRRHKNIKVAVPPRRLA